MRIDIYTTPTCGYCHQAKKYFTGRGFRYYEYDVSRDSDARERMVNLTGQMGVPVIVIDGKVIIGFDRMRIEKLLTNSGNGHRVHLGLKVADAEKYLHKPGAYIGMVEPNSPGEQAGLRRGDVIVSMDSNYIGSAHDLEDILSSTDIGRSITFVFVRDDRAMQTQVAM